MLFYIWEFVYFIYNFINSFWQLVYYNTKFSFVKRKMGLIK